MNTLFNPRQQKKQIFRYWSQKPGEAGGGLGMSEAPKFGSTDSDVVSDACKDSRAYPFDFFDVFNVMKRPICLSVLVYSYCQNRTNIRQADQLFKAGLTNIDRLLHLLFKLFELETIVMFLEVPSGSLFMLVIHPGFIAKGTQTTS